MSFTMTKSASDPPESLSSSMLEAKTLRSTSSRTRGGIRDDFRRYEIGVLAVTQLSYVPIAASLLSTSLNEPSASFCNDWSNNTLLGIESSDIEFHSVIVDWGAACKKSPLINVLSTTVMIGGLLGAFASGWLADRVGRKPVIQGCLIMVSLFNLLFVLFAFHSWIVASLLLLFLGVGCGGYMVTNLCLLVECLNHPQSRLLAVSLNGWSASMVVVAALAWLTSHYLPFHIIAAVAAICSAIFVQLMCKESARWLASVGRIAEARGVALNICRLNNQQVDEGSEWWEMLGFTEPTTRKLSTCKQHSYRDLIRYKSIFYPLCAMCYCFIASAIVSFGSYFIPLPGDRYFTMAMLGFSKFVLGLIPLTVSHWVGRRPIAIVSVSIAAFAAILILFIQTLGLDPTNISLIVLSLAMSSSIDPTWKINHLYSAELFPTNVRNMARGICNCGARIGSVIAPSVALLGSRWSLGPYIVFSGLLVVQLLVIWMFLPETKDRPLPDGIPEELAAAQTVSVEEDVEDAECKETV